MRNQEDDSGVHLPPEGMEPHQDGSFEHVLDRLRHVENRVGEQYKPWFRTPSNLISILALVASVGIFATTFWFGSKETQFQKLQQLGQVIDQISALAGKEVEAYRMDVPSIVRANASVAIANRRVALVNQVDRILADIDEGSVSKFELAVLAPAYLGIGRYDEAIEIYESLAEDDSAPLIEQVMAWRSLVSLYGFLGPDFLNSAESAADTGLDLIGEARGTQKDIMMMREAFSIPYSLGLSYFASRDYDKALHRFLEAERNAHEMPCGPNRSEFLLMSRDEVAKILPLYRDGRKIKEEARAKFGSRCPSDPTTPQAFSPDDGRQLSKGSDYDGDYVSVMGTASIRGDSERVLQMDLGSGRAVTLRSIGADIFSVRGAPGYYVSFPRDGMGNVTQVLFLEPNGIRSAVRNPTAIDAGNSERR
jgi:tetratricopeptide (TPR) repeat protein